MSLTKVSYSMINTAPVNVVDFGAVGDGVTNDTAAIQAALTSLIAYTKRSLYFPPGTYLINATLTAPIGLSSAEIFGASGYDFGSPLNNTQRTVIKWIGATSATTPMVQFDRASGIVWKGISLNCNYKAGYGIQFYSTERFVGSTNNTIERCTITYALADGIIIGQEGLPPTSNGDRQFFANRYDQLTFIGCARSGIHINEYNADLALFSQVWVYFDDAVVPQPCLNGFWFERGGQSSQMIACETGGLSVVAGKIGSGYHIKNGTDIPSAGAFGLLVQDAWHEGNGGLYFGQPPSITEKPHTFIKCNSFTADASPSVYIDKSGANTQIYAFYGCYFQNDMSIVSSTMKGSDLILSGTTFGSGKGVVNYSNQRVINGILNLGTTTSQSILISAFADFVITTINQNITVVYEEEVSSPNGEVSILVTQDATGGRTITWGAAFSSLPPIPAPTSAPGAKSMYTFISDGSLFYIKSFQG
jgi:hypothetical protein